MPGFTIHIAIAKQYIKENKLEIKNEEEFIKGSIVPDLNEELNEITTNKSKTHYGIWIDYDLTTNIDEFLEDSKIDIEQDYWKGYFMHLLADHYFYNKYLEKENKEIEKNNDRFYYDYNCLNKVLIEKYKLHILDNIEKYMNIYEGQPKYLKESKIIDFIEKISSMNIKDKIEIIKQKGMEGLE